MARVIGSSPLVQFETNDLFDSRWYFNRGMLHSIAVGSPAGENGQRVHVFTLNLMPGQQNQTFTAYYDAVDKRDSALLRLMVEFEINDTLTKAAVVTL